ncbi:radical SAM protein [Slackia heliotrinireducens]|uniref:radical SAM protein n=1 Tax=Slackia heliotrinireducens TaxID=84110 RepID=UPI00331494BC
MHYTGTTFRPPYEAYSLLLQVTTGCSHNRCTFCSMYSDVPFEVSPIEEIEADLAEVAARPRLYTRVFLVNGDAFCLPFEQLVKIAELIHKYLPKVETIGGYASVNNILTKSVDELRKLKDLGYADFNVGLESGSDETLTFMNKGYTLAQARQAFARLNEAGMPFNLNIILAAAGPDRCVDQAIANAEIVNEAKPTLVFVSPLHVDPHTELEEMIEKGQFKECTLRDYVTEEMEFLKRLDVEDCRFFGLHISNPVGVDGMLPQDKDTLLQELQEGLNDYTDWQLNRVPSKGREGLIIG